MTELTFCLTNNHTGEVRTWTSNPVVGMAKFRSYVNDDITMFPESASEIEVTISSKNEFIADKFQEKANKVLKMINWSPLKKGVFICYFGNLFLTTEYSML